MKASRLNLGNDIFGNGMDREHVTQLFFIQNAPATPFGLLACSNVLKDAWLCYICQAFKTSTRENNSKGLQGQESLPVQLVHANFEVQYLITTPHSSSRRVHRSTVKEVALRYCCCFSKISAFALSTLDLSTYPRCSTNANCHSNEHLRRGVARPSEHKPRRCGTHDKQSIWKIRRPFLAIPTPTAAQFHPPRHGPQRSTETT